MNSVAAVSVHVTLTCCKHSVYPAVVTLHYVDDSQTNDVNRKISMASKDVACQTEAIDAGRREHFQSGDSRPVVTVISVGVAGLVGAIIIHLVMRNDYLQKSVSALEKSVLEYERVIANLTELSRASSSLEESRDRLLEERLQLMSLIDGMNINLTKQTTASSLLEQEKRSLEENLTDVSHVVQRLSVKLSKVVAENRDLKRRRLFSRQCVGTRTARLNQCVESLKEAASTSEKEQETLLSENTKLKNEIAAMTLKLSDAVQARDKLLDETKQLKQKLEETLKRLETGEGRRCGGKHGHGKHGHGHHHHHHGHHGKRGRGKCGRR